MKRYTARKRNINGEKRRILALINTIIRAHDELVGSNHDRTRALRTLRSEIERDAHRGQT